MKHFYIPLIALLALLSSCGGDSLPQETTVAEDMANITAVVNDLIFCSEAVESGDITQLVKMFGGFSESEILNDDWAEEVFEELDDLLLFSKIADGDPFSFSSYSGTYTWNSGSSSWSYQNNLTNRIVIMLPDEPSNPNNNVVATISTYSQEQITFDFNNYWAPELVEATLTHNGEVVGSVSIQDVDYDHNSKYSIPTRLRAELFLAPNTYSFYLDRQTPTVFRFIFDVIEGSCDVKLDVELTLSNSDYDNLTEDDLDFGTGTLEFGNLKFDFEADLESLIALDDITPSDVNTFINADVYYRGNQIGELEYVEVNSGSSNEEVQIHIIYKDGTSDDMEVYYDDLMIAIENLTRPYLDADDEDWYPF